MTADEIKKLDAEIEAFYSTVRNSKLDPLNKAEFKPVKAEEKEAKVPEVEAPEIEAPEKKIEAKEKDYKSMPDKEWSKLPGAERQAHSEKKEMKDAEAPIAEGYIVPNESKVRNEQKLDSAIKARGGKGFEPETRVSQRNQPPSPKESKAMQDELKQVPALDTKATVAEGEPHPTKMQSGKPKEWTDEMAEHAKKTYKANTGNEVSQGDVGEIVDPARAGSTRNFKYFVGPYKTEREGVGDMKLKALELLTNYLFEEMKKSLSASMYSDYTDDIMNTITKSFVEDKQVVFEEIVKMSEEGEKTFPIDEFVKAHNELIDIVKSLSEEMETLKKAEKSVTPVEQPPVIEKYAEGVPTNVPNHELASDSSESVKSGDITVAGQKEKEGVNIPPVQEKPKIAHNAYHDDRALPVMHKEDTNAFVEGKKIGEIEAIKKQVEETGISAPRPGVVEPPLRETIIEKISANEKELLNTSWGKLEKNFIQKR